ncbi:MAG: MFS transporter [Thermoflexales bacterium]|nr:MFS transporter [Thermoflexales bacterium]
MSQTRSRRPRFAAFQHRDYRLLWLGQLVSQTGTQMQLTTVNWHIFTLLRGQTFVVDVFGSPATFDAPAFALGALGLVRIVPIIVFALLGGIVADTRDRRKVMMITQTVAGLAAALLAIATLAGFEALWVIYILTAVNASAMAFDSPSRQALVPRLVPREDLTNALSLNTTLMQVTSIIGPSLAGVLIASVDPGLIYAFNALSFGAVVLALLLMEHRTPPAASVSTITLSAMLDGARFVFRERIILSSMLLDFFATFFASARTMLPVIAADILHTDAHGYGLLSAAQSVGSVIAGLVASLRHDIPRQGRVLLISVIVYGLATALFGLSTNFALSYFLFAITGAADTVSTVIRGTMRQLLTPDHLRGRMVGINMMFFMGGPQLGEAEAGLVASRWGIVASVVSGGLLCLACSTLVAWRYPTLRQYDGPHSVPAPAASH